MKKENKRKKRNSKVIYVLQSISKDQISKRTNIFQNKRANTTTISWYLVFFGLGVGVAIGLYALPNAYLSYPYNYISHCLMYVYASSWCIRYYPQIILNIHRRSTLGLSIDTLCISIIGFLLYTIYNIYFYFQPDRNKYYLTNRNDNDNMSQISKRSIHKFNEIIDFGDLFFSIHAVVAILIIIIQCLWYDGIAQLPQPYTLAIMSMIILFSFIYLFIIYYISNDKDPFTLVDWLFSISIITVITETTRLIPQFMINYESHIFIGIDLGAVTLDLIGGLASFSQVVFDSYDMYGYDHIIEGLRGTLYIIYIYIYIS